MKIITLTLAAFLLTFASAQAETGYVKRDTKKGFGFAVSNETGRTVFFQEQDVQNLDQHQSLNRGACLQFDQDEKGQAYNIRVVDCQ